MEVFELLKKDRFANLLGITLNTAQAGNASAQLTIVDAHLNAANCVQGGVLFSLADFTLAAAANSYGDKLALSIECDIKFIRAASNGILVAQATEKHRTSKLGYYDVEILDDKQQLIASLSGIAYFIDNSRTKPIKA